MKNMKKWLLCSVLFLHLVTPANAFTDPAQVKLLTQQLVILKEQLDKAKEQVDEIKVVNDEVIEMRDTVDHLYKEYEALANTDLLKDLEYIKKKYEDLTYLDDLKDADSIKEKYQLLHKEIALRFKDSNGNKSEPVPLESQMQKTVVDLNQADAQILYYQKRLEDLSGEGVTNKDIDKINAQAQATNALLGLEAKKKELDQQRAAQEDLKRQTDWNNEFLGYIKNKEMTDSALEDTIISRLIVNTLNPKAVYEGMFKLSGIGTLFLWFFVIFFAFRLLKESFASLGQGGSLLTALSQANQSVLGYVIYASAGVGLFAIIFVFMELFESSTSTHFIHSHLLETRQSLITNSKTYDSWIEKTLEYVVDSSNTVNTAIVWTVYQAVSVIYVVMNQFIDVLFAVAIAFCWMFGFLAIASNVLPDDFQMVKGWLSTIYGLFVWVVAEILLMSMLSLISYGGASWIESNYSNFGAGFTGLLVWHAFAIIMMGLVLIFKIAAIVFAYMLSRNQSMLGMVGAMPAALGAILVSKTIPNNTMGGGDQEEGGVVSSMMPDAAGDRNRDRFARGGEAVSNVLNSPISDVVRASTTGLGNLGNTAVDFFRSGGFGGGASNHSASSTSQDSHHSGADQHAESTQTNEHSTSDQSGEQVAADTMSGHSSSGESTPRQTTAGGYVNDEPPMPTDYEAYAAMQSYETEGQPS